jgi:hypothetical protein
MGQRLTPVVVISERFLPDESHFFTKIISFCEVGPKIFFMSITPHHESASSEARVAVVNISTERCPAFEANTR